MAEHSFDRYRWWLCALSGLLLALSLAPFSLATLGWIGLVPAWWAVTRSKQVQCQPLRHGYLIGLIYFGGAFWWISNVTVPGTLFLVLYTALYPGLWFLLIARLLRRGVRHSTVFEAAAAAALWVMLEWWRSWFLTGFDWDELGDSQAPSLIFRQLAAYGGIPLISFVLVLVNILWAEGVLALIPKLRAGPSLRLPLSFATALLVVSGCFALGWHHLQRHRGEPLKSSVTFACIQPNIPQIPYDGGPWINFQTREQSALEIHQKLSAQAIKTEPDLLVWPEATLDEGVFQDRPLNEAVQSICQIYDGYFLLGSQDFELQGHKLYNVAYFFSPKGERYDEYRKTRLVVLGEYLPFGDVFPWMRKAVGIGMDFTPGPEPRTFNLEKKGLTLAPLICFEDTLADVADKVARLRPDFFVTITNDGWYRGWFAAWGLRQHLSHAIFRCVEHDRPMLRCGNNGISCVIDQNGTVTSRFRDAAGNEIDVGGIFAGRLEFYPAHPTGHEAWGDWIVLLSALISVMLSVPFFLCRRQDLSRES